MAFYKWNLHKICIINLIQHWICKSVLQKKKSWFVQIQSFTSDMSSLSLRWVLQSVLCLIVEQHPTEHRQGLHWVGKFTCDQVNADSISLLQRKYDVEDDQGARSVPCLGNGFLKTLRLIACRISTGNTIIGFRQDCLNLHILVTCQDCTEEVSPIHRSSEQTCQNTFGRAFMIMTVLNSHTIWLSLTYIPVFGL